MTKPDPKTQRRAELQAAAADVNARRVKAREVALVAAGRCQPPILPMTPRRTREEAQRVSVLATFQTWNEQRLEDAELMALVDEIGPLAVFVADQHAYRDSAQREALAQLNAWHARDGVTVGKDDASVQALPRTHGRNPMPDDDALMDMIGEAFFRLTGKLPARVNREVQLPNRTETRRLGNFLLFCREMQRGLSLPSRFASDERIKALVRRRALSISSPN